MDPIFEDMIGALQEIEELVAIAVVGCEEYARDATGPIGFGLHDLVVQPLSDHPYLGLGSGGGERAGRERSIVIVLLCGIVVLISVPIAIVCCWC